jgi:hypothetical protein
MVFLKIDKKFITFSKSHLKNDKPIHHFDTGKIVFPCEEYQDIVSALEYV